MWPETATALRELGYYRESPLEREVCFDVIDYDTSGINPLILATISDRIETTIYGIELYLPAF